MKKTLSIMVFILALSSCQTNQEQNIAPAEKAVANNNANLREGIKVSEPIKDDEILLEEGNVMTATLVARRGDSPEAIKEQLFAQLSKEDKQGTSEKENAIRNDEIEILIRHYQQVFKENEECQAIFRDDISKVEFGYIKELSAKQTTLKGIVCEKCKDNGVIIPIICDTCRGGALSEWLRAILCN